MSQNFTQIFTVCLTGRCKCSLIRPQGYPSRRSSALRSSSPSWQSCVCCPCGRCVPARCFSNVRSATHRVVRSKRLSRGPLRTADLPLVIPPKYLMMPLSSPRMQLGEQQQKAARFFGAEAATFLDLEGKFAAMLDGNTLHDSEGWFSKARGAHGAPLMRRHDGCAPTVSHLAEP